MSDVYNPLFPTTSSVIGSMDQVRLGPSEYQPDYANVRRPLDVPGMPMPEGITLPEAEAGMVRIPTPDGGSELISRDQLARNIAMSGTPRAESDRQEVIALLHELTGRPAAELAGDLENILHHMAGEPVDIPEAKTALQQWWWNGQYYRYSNQLKADYREAVLQGDWAAASQAEAQINRIDQYLSQNDVSSSNLFVEKAVKPLLQMIPRLADPTFQGATLNLGTASLATMLMAMAGVPLTAGASLLAVPTAIAMGTGLGSAAGAVVSTSNWANQIHADNFWDLYNTEDPRTGERMDPRLISAVLWPFAGIEALVETMQMSQFMPEGSTLNIGMRGFTDQFVGKLVANGTLKHWLYEGLAKYGGRVTDEASEEFIQGVVSGIAQLAATEMQNLVHDTNFDTQSFQEIYENALTEFVESIGPIALMSLPGSSVEAVQAGLRNRAEVTAQDNASNQFVRHVSNVIQAAERLSAESEGRELSELEMEFTEAYNKVMSEGDEAAAIRMLDLAAELDLADRTTEQEPSIETQRRDEWLRSQTPLSEAGERLKSRVLETTKNIDDTGATIVAMMMEERASSRGMELDAYIAEEFDPRIAGQAGEIYQELRPGEEMPGGKKGFFAFTRDAKAIIGLTERSDLSTWIHELGHKWRTELAGDLLATAEEYYGVKGGDWGTAVEGRFNEDGTPMIADEAFTEDLTTLIMTGKVQNERIRPFLQRAAEFLKKIYQAITGRAPVNPEIQEVMQSLFTPSQEMGQATTDQNVRYQGENAFDQWFGQSKVVDRAGSPLRVYHGGSTENISEFRHAYEMGETDAAGLYFTPDESMAGEYALAGGLGAEAMTEAYLSLQNPLITGDPDISGFLTRERMQDLQAQGFDGIIGTDDEGNITEAVAFRPEQIKSTKNTGSWDPEDPDIRYQTVAPSQEIDEDIGDADAYGEASLEAGERSILFQTRPPFKGRALQRWLDTLDPQARATYDLLANTVSIGESVAKGAKNPFLRYLIPQDWNTLVRGDARIAKAARELMKILPDGVREAAHLNKNGTVRVSAMEKLFKMGRSMTQRIIDALPLESISPEYETGGQDISTTTASRQLVVGGEQYRRALVQAYREMYEDGKLKPKKIGGLSKDTWGALGFLASNEKTTASGDFTTMCPQMYFNKGCWYCYRASALRSGVNNKLTAEKVWYAGEILQIHQSSIDELNRTGGLRIQSFGDWMPHFAPMLTDVLIDAEMRGLQVKIITKEPSMIEAIANLKKQGLGKSVYFNLSSDYFMERVGRKESSEYEPMNYDRPLSTGEEAGVEGDKHLWWKRALSPDEAAEFRGKYPWVKVRIVASTVDDFIAGLRDPNIDVITGYHGTIRSPGQIPGGELINTRTGEQITHIDPIGDNGMPRFNIDGSLQYAGKTKYHKELARRIQEEGLQSEYWTKACCITGKCHLCATRCGVDEFSENTQQRLREKGELPEVVQYWRDYKAARAAGEDTSVLFQSEDLKKAKAREAFAAAKKAFGTTKDPREAAYILPDGAMLDFSAGRPGRRTMDHRDIRTRGNPAKLRKSGTDGMYEWMAKGAVRIDARAGVATVLGVPTKKQIQQIVFAFDYSESHGKYVAYEDKKGRSIKNWSGAEATADKLARFFRAARAEADAQGEPVLFQPMAWHGSGADFERFSLDYLGTGEGAQAFGWGQYLSGAREVGEWYAESIGNRPENLRADGPADLVAHYDAIAEDLAYAYDDLWRKAGGHASGTALMRAAIRWLVKSMEFKVREAAHSVNWAAKQTPNNEVAKQAIASQLSTFTNRLEEKKTDLAHAEALAERIDELTVEPSRHLYSVEIAPGQVDAPLMGWDEPAPDGLVETLRERGYKVIDRYTAGRINTEDDFPEGITAIAGGSQIWHEKLGDGIHQYKLLTGGAEFRLTFEEALRMLGAPDTGQAVYEALSRELGSDKAASLALLDAGIIGHRYPAGTLSGQGGKGVYNYVIYDDQALKINDHIRWQTETPEFKRWFGDSKVVDEHGDPQRVFHGTDQQVTIFGGESAPTDLARIGWHYFSDSPEFASKFAYSAKPFGTEEAPTRKVSIAMPDGPMEVDAWDSGIPGLAITQMDGGNFALTHEASGFGTGVRATDLDSMRDAVAEFATVKGVDWTLPHAELSASITANKKQLAAAVRRANDVASVSMFNAASMGWSGKTGFGEGSQMMAVHLSMQNPVDLTSLRAKNVSPKMLIDALAKYGIHLSMAQLPFSGRSLYQMLNVTEVAEEIRAQAKENGYDGVIFNDIYDEKLRGTSYIVFESNQIKSATGNTGAYGLDEDDIRWQTEYHPTESRIRFQTTEQDLRRSLPDAKLITPSITDAGREILEMSSVELHKRLEAKTINHYWSLPDLIDDQELFDKHPALRTTKVAFRQESYFYDRSLLGSFESSMFQEGGVISIKVTEKGKDRNATEVFFHELQHAIQYAVFGEEVFSTEDEDVDIPEPPQTPRAGRFDEIDNYWSLDEYNSLEEAVLGVLDGMSIEEWQSMTTEDKKDFATFYGDIETLVEWYSDPKVRREIDAYIQYKKDLGTAEVAAFDAYMNNALEVHARAAQQGTIRFQPDAHEQAVRSAVEAGRYIPTPVLKDYAGSVWADAELEAREALRAEAGQFESVGDFVQYGIDGGDKGVDYYASLWEERKTQGQRTDYDQLAEESRRLRTENKKLGKTHAKLTEQLAAHWEALKSARQEAMKASGDRRTALREALESAKKEGRLVAKGVRDYYHMREYIERTIRKIMKRPGASIDWSYAKQIIDIQAGLKVSNGRREQQAIKALEKILEESKDPTLKKWLQMQLNARSMKDMSIEVLEEIRDQIEDLRERGKAAQDAKLKAWRDDVTATAAAVATSIRGGKQGKPLEAIGSQETQARVKTGVWKAIKFESLRPPRIAEMFDGGKRGIIYTLLVDEVNAAIDSELKVTDQRIDEGRLKMRELGIKEKALGATITIGEVTYTRDEVIHLYIAMQNMDSAKAVAYGNKIDPKLIEAFIKQLTPQEKQWGNWMISSFGDENYNRIQEVLGLDKNQILEQVARYFPMIRKEQNYETHDGAIVDELLTRSATRRATVDRGFTKGRIEIAPEHQTPIALGATKLWAEQVARQEHYMQMGLLIKKLKQVFNDKDVLAALNEQYGTEAQKWVNKYIGDIANPNIYKLFDSVSKTSRLLRQHAALSYLGFNVVTMMKQIPSISFFLAKAGPGDLVIGAMQYLSNPVKWDQIINDKDPQQKHRSLDRVFEELKLLDANAYERFVQTIGKAGMAPIRFIDKQVTNIGWLSTYNRVMRQTHNEAEAVRAAQEAVLSTQPAGAAKDLAQMYRQSETMNWFLMFTNQLNQIWNMMISDIPNGLRQGGVARPLSYAVSIGISALAMAFMAHGFKGWDPEDEEDGLAVDLFKQLISYIPVIGGTMKAGFEGWFGTGVDPFPLAEGVGQALRAWTDNEKDVEVKLNSLVNLMIDGMVVGGLPTVQSKRIYNAITEQDIMELLGTSSEEE